jgi:hypothetical protein
MRPKNAELVAAVKVFLPWSHTKGGTFRTFRSASAASTAWAHAVTRKLLRNKPLTFPSVLHANFVKYTYDSNEYARHFGNSRRRALKIFKAKGLK